MSQEKDRLLTRKEAAAEFNVHVSPPTWWRWEDPTLPVYLVPQKHGARSARVRYWESNLRSFFQYSTRKR